MQDFFRQFAHWVRAAPDELAIVSEGQSLTYAVFDRAVDHYAAFLRGQSGGQNKVAAYLGDVGIPRTIAVVAALKAGVAIYWLDSALAAGVARPIVDQFQTDFIIAEPGFARRSCGPIRPSGFGGAPGPCAIGACGTIPLYRH